MKKLALLTLTVSLTFFSLAQDEHGSKETHSKTDLKSLPSVQLKDMEGNVVNTAHLGFDGPVVISFWATWCSPCKKELNAIHAKYNDWQNETGVSFVAVSIDDEKTMASVPLYVKAKEWNYTVLMDTKGELKEAMAVDNVPHTFVIDRDGKIVYSHNNYVAGDEEKLYDILLKLKEAESN